MNEEHQEKAVEKMKDFMKDLEYIGLYSEGFALTPHFSEDSNFEDENAEPDHYMLIGSFKIGDRAFSVDVQDPEQAAVNEEARNMLPTASESIQEKIRQALADGVDLFDIDLGEDV